MKKLLKLLATNYRKVTLYGDRTIEEWGFSYEFRGRRIDVKILDLFWTTYSYYTIR
jgi:hypothetical protein